MTRFGAGTKDDVLPRSPRSGRRGWLVLSAEVLLLLHDKGQWAVRAVGSWGLGRGLLEALGVEVLLLLRLVLRRNRGLTVHGLVVGVGRAGRGVVWRGGVLPWNAVVAGSRRMAGRCRSGRGGTAWDWHQHWDWGGSGWKHVRNAAVRKLRRDQVNAGADVVGEEDSSVAGLDGVDLGGVRNLRVVVLFGRAWRRRQDVNLHRRLARLGHLVLYTVDAVAQMCEESAPGHRIDVREPVDLLGALAEASFELVHHVRIRRLGHGGLLALQILQVLHRHLQNVCLLKL